MKPPTHCVYCNRLLVLSESEVAPPSLCCEKCLTKGYFKYYFTLNAEKTEIGCMNLMYGNFRLLWEEKWCRMYEVNDEGFAECIIDFKSPVHIDISSVESIAEKFKLLLTFS